MPLFEVAIIEHPTKVELERGESEKIVLQPVAVVAKDAQTAAISAILDESKKDLKLDKSRMEVLVRPFV